MAGKQKPIYLDYAAATPINPEVARLMAKITGQVFGNPSSVHSFGAEAKKVLEDSRQKIARLLGVKADEIIFTGSGTESTNLAILGVAMAYKRNMRKGPGSLNRGHIVTSRIEHLAVLNTCRKLEKWGFKVTYLPVEKNGLVNSRKVMEAITPETFLVSIQYANNEIGTIQPIKEISLGVVFHTDACQAAGFLNIRPETLGVDLLSFNGSKIYGPKGVGVLFKKNKVPLEPMIFGGSQEKGMRAGTENVALAAGMALALELAEKTKKEEGNRLIVLRDWLIGKILAEITETKLNGDAKKRLPNNINISFKGIDGEMLMLGLSRQGFAVSTGSACTTSQTGPSHVISALGPTKGYGNLRISLGREITRQDLEKFLEVLNKEVKRLRKVI